MLENNIINVIVFRYIQRNQRRLLNIYFFNYLKVEIVSNYNKSTTVI